MAIITICSILKHFQHTSNSLLGLTGSEHPMFSVFNAMGDGYMFDPKESSSPITNDCYSISFKKIVKDDLNYWRTKLDFTNRAMFCNVPRQVTQRDKRKWFEKKGLFHQLSRRFSKWH